VEGGREFFGGDGEKRLEGEGGKRVGGEGGGGSGGKVEELVMEDGCHGQGISHGATSCGGEGGNPGAVMAMTPFFHVPDAHIRVIK